MQRPLTNGNIHHSVCNSHATAAFAPGPERTLSSVGEWLLHACTDDRCGFETVSLFLFKAGTTGVVIEMCIKFSKDLGPGTGQNAPVEVVVMAMRRVSFPVFIRGRCLRIREAHQEASRDKANSKFQKFKF